VSVVVAAHDEERWIRAKVENTLALDYPEDRLELLVGCDGCADGTAREARAAAEGSGRVRVLEYPVRAGKASVLTRTVPHARGDLVVLTDANTMLDPRALRGLARRFEDPAVGAAVGRLRLVTPGKPGHAEGLYWRYETALKLWEGRRGAVIGANGGIYAIRRLLWQPLAADTIVDDLVVPARIAVRGWKVVYAPDAVAVEEATGDAGREFVRRARIGAGDWQALRRVPELLDPRTGFVCFAFVGHKLLRWTAPLWLAGALVASAVLSLAPGAWGARAILVAQAAFYGLAWAGRRGGVRGALARAASFAHYFVAMNAALAVGFWRFLRNAQGAAWERAGGAPASGTASG
jgi:cellulose synthase/poly-beta-1,6-N-acetylglucosamine synthase-like glycosyltransferase